MFHRYYMKSMKLAGHEFRVQAECFSARESKRKMRGGGSRIGFLLVLAVTVGTVPLFQNDPYLSSDPYHQRLADPNFRPRKEQDPGNKTIDQLITEAYGGLPMYMAESFLDLSGDITTELDMVLTAEQYKAMYLKQEVKGGRVKRKATRPLVYRWTDATIPYEFVTSHFNEDEVYYIQKAMDRWQETTCVKFRPYASTDKNRIRFQNGNGCNSLLGMNGFRGVQAINLQSPGCRYSGLYLHEIGHAIGLVHEHQLPDRDQYIYIIYDNVAPSMRQWFDKYDEKDVNQYGVPFEYSSVMHYGVQAFSKDGSSQTIRARDPTREKEIGRVYLKGLSFTDIKVVNLMYECNKHCLADPSCKEPAYLDKNCKCVKPEDVTTTTTTTTKDGCYNIWDDAECGGWASRGECDKNPLWMKDNCKKSCEACTDTGGGKPDEKECTNIWGDFKCNPWADRGECEANPEWMRENCAKACDACESTTTTTTTTVTCVDNNQWCESWAKSGYCTSNWYTQENCHKSCNTCDKVKTRDGNNVKDDEDRDGGSTNTGTGTNTGSKDSGSGASSGLHSPSVIFLLIVASFLAVKF